MSLQQAILHFVGKVLNNEKAVGIGSPLLRDDQIQKSPQEVKHVVKGEKWSCSTPKEGKNKPIMIIAKTRYFKRFSEEIKENRRFG